MVKGRNNVYTIVLTIVLVAALAMVFFENVGAITGHVTESTVSNVTIQSFLSIQMSQNLTAGIVFENVSTLPVTDQNATHNYDGVGTGTGYYIEISADGNKPVDFCLRANRALENAGADTISIDKETYSTNVTTTNGTVPDVALQGPMSLIYNKTAIAVPIGATNYYRFWLDIPASQQPGTYDNVVFFKAVATGSTNATCDAI